MKIIARKPSDPQSAVEFVVIDRGSDGENTELFDRYVSATVDPHSISNGAWHRGHYFYDRAEALAHFNNRGSAQS